MKHMASSFIRKTLTPIAAVAILTTSAEATTSYTLAAGYVQVNVNEGGLAAVSATLQNKSDHTSNATVNADYDSVAGTQTVTVTGAGWGANVFLGGYLCYIADSTGGEEAFLIESHTSDTLTILTTFDLLDVARTIPAATSISIRKGQTLATLFGAPPNTDIGTGDNLYLWSGGSWTTYYVAGGAWRKIGGGFSTFNDDIVFPDEGFFIQRASGNGDLTLTFFGDVPGKAQVTTIPGPDAAAPPTQTVLQFLSGRYPVETTIGALGFENLPKWRAGAGGDLVYLWSQTEGWVTYYYQTGWRKIGGGFATFENDVVPADSGLFVQRGKPAVGDPATPAESANAHALPYTP